MPLDVRESTCPHCITHHDRDGNVAINIKTEGIRMLALSEVEGIKAEGAAVWRCRKGDKTKTWAKVSVAAHTVLGTPSQCGQFTPVD